MGILFNRTGNVNKTIKKQAEKATKECLKFWKEVENITSEIWGFSKNIQCLEKVQHRFCKLSLKLKTSTPSYMIYGEFGLFPIGIQLIIRTIPRHYMITLNY